MRQIGETFALEGGFSKELLSGSQRSNSDGGGRGEMPVYDAFAEIYRLVSEDTILGEEKVDKRKRGRDPEDVAACVLHGIRKRRRSMSGQQDLGLTWRGSWL